MVSARLATPIALTAALLLLAGCSGQPSTGPTSPGSPTPAIVVPAVSTCVADPAAVIARTADLPTSAMPADLTATIDKAAQAGFSAASAKGAVVAVQSPKGLFLKAYGIADPATGAPMTTDVYQRVGSITKPFTGTLTMQLVADGRIGLDDPISKYVDGVPNGDKVTIRMLADMTSAVTSYTKDDGWQKIFFSEPTKVWTPDELLKAGLSLKPQDFAPGTAFDYSNTNTILLGKVIEKVTGKSYQDVLAEKITTPLGMTHTIFPGGSAAFPDPHAQGFTLQGGHGTPDNPANATDWNPSWGWSAGELISSAQDLLRFGRAEATGAGLLPAKLQTERLTSFREFAGAGTGGYGIGWGCQNGWVGHTGELPGYNTSMFYSTKDDTTVIVLSNSDIPTGKCEARTLTDNPTDLPCSSPATRVFTGIATALGTPFAPQKK
ncbi:serine hydrolase domain-containing protein [Microbacterium capsulatum]|uniref:Serine hydrolase domain-containing protein n=1 Tax=Microbacterium capsulatum TaxID=3041921 RepID=A0ABU0XI96_9MICO|nr:serine hydrolase domain-containing protein [Microbacterium sp. ASV81]MDQ4214858.1 serine hydrolase domain-containing protein [Microbacterium sp. ASV81]